MFLRPRSVFWLALVCVLGVALGRPAAGPPDPANLERHVALGMPFEANKTDKNAFLIKKEFFTISYNNSKGTPNWVAWSLLKTDFGKSKRPQNAFHPDKLSVEFHTVKPADYNFTKTGFQRGHMCPNADRDFDKDRATTTFVMTNMVPQTAELNEQAWGKLEAYCRGLVDDDEDKQELFIFAGPQGKGGRSDMGFFNTTDGKVVVPTHCWKVVVCLPAGNTDPIKRVTAETRVIAVIMPNDRTPTNAWGKYRVSVEKVEELTGFTFFDKVDPGVRKVLIKQVDEERIPGG